MRSFFRRKDKDAGPELGELVGNESKRHLIHADFMHRGENTVMVFSENERVLDIIVFGPEGLLGHVDPNLSRIELSAVLGSSNIGKFTQLCTGCIHEFGDDE